MFNATQQSVYDLAQVHKIRFKCIVEYKVVCIRSMAHCTDAISPGRPLFTLPAPPVSHSSYTRHMYDLYQIHSLMLIYSSSKSYSACRVDTNIQCIRPLEYMYMPPGLRIDVEYGCRFCIHRGTEDTYFSPNTQSVETQFAQPIPSANDAIITEQEENQPSLHGGRKGPCKQGRLSQEGVPQRGARQLNRS